eukprot:1177866-Prorocentrum_minimum.AAC.2
MGRLGNKQKEASTRLLPRGMQTPCRRQSPNSPKTAKSCTEKDSERRKEKNGGRPKVQERRWQDGDPRPHKKGPPV